MALSSNEELLYAQNVARSLDRIAHAGERIADALERAADPACACGCAEALHIPKCNTIRCKCERYTLPATALVSILNQHLIQTMDLKMVIAMATGQVEGGKAGGPPSIVRP